MAAAVDRWTCHFQYYILFVPLTLVVGLVPKVLALGGIFYFLLCRSDDLPDPNSLLFDVSYQHSGNYGMIKRADRMFDLGEKYHYGRLWAMGLM